MEGRQRRSFADDYKRHGRSGWFEWPPDPRLVLLPAGKEVHRGRDAARSRAEGTLCFESSISRGLNPSGSQAASGSFTYKSPIRRYYLRAVDRFQRILGSSLQLWLGLIYADGAAL
jgi:hypothetical protein